MGYELHITRAEHWSENEGKEISAEEWLAAVRGDRELTLVPEHGPHFARWSGASRHRDPWLDWSAGNVYTKNPDSALLRKMMHLAEQLGGRVQGDDGELYAGDEPLDDYLTPSSGSAQQPAQPTSWWRRLTGR